MAVQCGNPGRGQAPPLQGTNSFVSHPELDEGSPSRTHRLAWGRSLVKLGMTEVEERG